MSKWVPIPNTFETPIGQFIEHNWAIFGAQNLVTLRWLDPSATATFCWKRFAENIFDLFFKLKPLKKKDSSNDVMRIFWTGCIAEVTSGAGAGCALPMREGWCSNPIPMLLALRQMVEAKICQLKTYRFWS